MSAVTKSVSPFSSAALQRSSDLAWLRSPSLAPRDLSRESAQRHFARRERSPVPEPLPRLSLASLDHVPRHVRRPTFDVRALRPGILHLGCGVFHRAHEAVFTQRAIEAVGGRYPVPWGIVGGSLVTPKSRDLLAPQSGLYTVLERGPDSVNTEVIGTIRDVVFAGRDSERLIRRFTDPNIKIVSLTVTAAGYHLDPATGRLSTRSPELERELTVSSPFSGVGVLVRGLDRVRREGCRPPVIICCDNLPGNGRTVRQAVIDYASLLDDSLARWIEMKVQFPCTMVDRIVPTVTESDLADAAALLGMRDEAALSAEPFLQWVIEDFEGPRPAWELAGATFTPDVKPWETSKLRLLNGTHMAIAYLGALAGLRTVGSFVADPLFGAYALRFMLQEQMPTLPPSSHDIVAYAHQLLDRWRNPGISHHLARVGQNGSDKLQVRLLASLCENLTAGRPAPCIILAVAAWICCMTGVTCPVERPRGATMIFHDPRARWLQELGSAFGGDIEGLVDAVLSLRQVFGDELPRVETFRSSLVRSVADLQEKGARRAVASLLTTVSPCLG